MRHPLFTLFLPLALLATASPVHSEDRAPQTRLFDFSIEDQFRQKHTDEEFTGRVAILVWADRKANDFAPAWFAALDSALGTSLADSLWQLRTVAHTKGAPFFVKGKIRKSFSKAPAEWALLDWKGRFREAYALPEKQVSVLVFDPRGRLVDQVGGTDLDNSAVKRVVTSVLEATEDPAE